MRLTISPVEPLGEARAKFIAMSRVLNGVRGFDAGIAVDLDLRDVAAREIAAKPFGAAKPIPSKAAGLLRVAWQTELAARLGEQLDDPGLRLATLQTLPVQAYYAIFSAARALTHTANAPRDTHTAIHNAYAGEHRRRTVGSWSVQLSGDPEDLRTSALSPPICDPVSFNPMEVRENDAEYVWTALRMARRWRLERARERWLSDRKNRTKQGLAYRRLPSAARKGLALSERPTTMMDFLYELRCGTNYRSIDEYAVDIDDETVSAFHVGLRHLLDLGLLTYEGQVALYAGAGALQDEYASWAGRVRTVGAWATASGQARMDALARAGL